MRKISGVCYKHIPNCRLIVSYLSCLKRTGSGRMRRFEGETKYIRVSICQSLNMWKLHYVKASFCRSFNMLKLQNVKASLCRILKISKPHYVEASICRSLKISKHHYVVASNVDSHYVEYSKFQSLIMSKPKQDNAPLNRSFNMLKLLKLQYVEASEASIC